jgi:hypothetical protein
MRLSRKLSVKQVPKRIRTRTKTLRTRVQKAAPKPFPRWLAVLLLALLIVGVSLQWAGLKAVNWVLETQLGENITGHADGFSIRPFQAGISVHKTAVWMKNSSKPPLVELDELRARIAWVPLLHGEISAHVLMDHLILQVSDKNEERAQPLTGKPASDWRKTLKDLIPITFESVRIKNSQARFENLNFKTPLTVALTDLNIQARNLRSRKNRNEPYSPVELHGVLQGHAPFRVNGKVDVLSTPPRGKLEWELKDFELNTVNKLLRAYIPLDFTRGKLSVFGEAKTEKGEADGYTKLIFDHLKVLGTKQKYVNTKQFFYEIIAGLGNWLFKNTKKDELTTRIPFHLSGEKLDIDKGVAFKTAVQSGSKPQKKQVDHTVKLPAKK